MSVADAPSLVAEASATVGGRPVSINDLMPLMPPFFALLAYFGLLTLVGIVLIIAMVRVPPDKIPELVQHVASIFRRLADRLPGGSREARADRTRGMVAGQDAIGDPALDASGGVVSDADVLGTTLAGVQVADPEEES